MTSNKRLDFGDGPDHDANLGMLKGIFTIGDRAPVRWSTQQTDYGLPY